MFRRGEFAMPPVEHYLKPASQGWDDVTMLALLLLVLADHRTITPVPFDLARAPLAEARKLNGLLVVVTLDLIDDGMTYGAWTVYGNNSPDDGSERSLWIPASRRMAPSGRALGVLWVIDHPPRNVGAGTFPGFVEVRVVLVG